MSIIETIDGSSIDARQPRATARERRRLQTQERIRSVAFELFRSRGFEETTVDEIAAAAGISRRTFFNHFPNKDDVVARQFDAFEQLIGEAARRHATTESCPYLVASRAAADALAASEVTAEDLRDLLRLVLANPTLAVRIFDRQLRWERAVIDAIAEAVPERFAPDEVAAGVASAFAVLRSASLSWAAGGADDLRGHVEPLLKRFAPPIGGDAAAG